MRPRGSPSAWEVRKGGDAPPNVLAYLFVEEASHRRYLRWPDVAVPRLPLHHGGQGRPDACAIEVTEEGTDERRAHDAIEHGPPSRTRDLGGRHQDPGERDVGGCGAACRVGPIDDDGTARGEDDVQRVQIQVEETRAIPERGRDPVRGGQLMQAPMERGERRRLPTVRPGPMLELLEHGATLDTLHDELRAIRAQHLHPRRWISTLGDVAHDRRLLRHGAAAARATEDQTCTILEDLGVAAGSEQRPELAHARYCNASWRRRLVASRTKETHGERSVSFRCSNGLFLAPSARCGRASSGRSCRSST